MSLSYTFMDDNKSAGIDFKSQIIENTWRGNYNFYFVNITITTTITIIFEKAWRDIYVSVKLSTVDKSKKVSSTIPSN